MEMAAARSARPPVTDNGTTGSGEPDRRERLGDRGSLVLGLVLATALVVALVVGVLLSVQYGQRDSSVVPLAAGGGRDEEGRGANPIAMIATIIFAPLAAMLIQMAVSRSREFQADASGARLTRRPLGLASALGKLHQANQIVPMNANPATSHLFIVNPLSGRSLANLFATHPPIEERIARLRAMRV